jgi:hypothetical protein
MIAFRWAAAVAGGAIVIFGIGCSDSNKTTIVDQVNPIPSEVGAAIPSGDVIAANGSPDFDGDGAPDFYLTYGSAVQFRNVAVGVLVSVAGDVARFGRRTELSIDVADVNRDGNADLTIMWPNDGPLTCSYAYLNGRWAVIEAANLDEVACSGALNS